MSRTKRKPYRRSRRFDATCRCHGACPWCYGARMYRWLKRLPADWREQMKRIMDD